LPYGIIGQIGGNMSRSFRKVPMFKIHTVKYFKKLVHKRNRHKPDIANGGAYKYSVNYWDICDYKWIAWKKDFTWWFANKEYKAWRK
jgi:hypothetical protein